MFFKKKKINEKMLSKMCDTVRDTSRACENYVERIEEKNNEELILYALMRLHTEIEKSIDVEKENSLNENK